MKDYRVTVAAADLATDTLTIESLLVG